MSLILLVMGHILASIFTNDQRIIHIAAVYLVILPCSYAFWGFIMMTNANFNSIGQPFKSTGITFVRLGLVFIPLSFVLGHFWGYIGVFSAFALANVITSLGAFSLGVFNWRRVLREN